MHNEWFSYMSKSLQKNLSFILKIQVVQANLLQPFTCIESYLYEKYKIWKYINQ